MALDVAPELRARFIELYRAFNARDIDAVLAQLHPAVDWPNGMEGGRVLGHAGVRDYWRRQWTLIDPHVEPRDFASDEAGHVTITVRQVVRDREGAVRSDRMVRHVYTFEDGLVRRMDIVEGKP
jgi:hypothetical protein